MASKQTPSPRRFPGALSGGERQDNDDHRVGETQRQAPKIDVVDPAPTQPRPDASDDDTQGRSTPEEGNRTS